MMGINARIRMAKAKATNLARSNARYDRIVAHSEGGSTKREAAADIGITPRGVDMILKRKGLPISWPINPEDLK